MVETVQILLCEDSKVSCNVKQGQYFSINILRIELICQVKKGLNF